MSGTPATIHRPAHRVGTTLRAFAVDIAKADGPLDLAGATASMAWEDQDGAPVTEWELGNPLKPGLTVPDPADGRIYIGAGAPDPFPLPAGTTYLRGDLTLVIAETFVPVRVLIPIFEGVA
jgi:hypothetical protein